MKVQQTEMAWQKGDIPGEILFSFPVPHSPAAQIVKNIKDQFSDVGEREISISSLFPYKNIVGRYKADTAQKSLFIRISSRLGNSSLEKEIIDHLNYSGVLVNRILKSIRIDLQEIPYRLDVRPFIDGRHFNKSDNDLSLLGARMKLLHLSLKRFRNQKAVKLASSERYNRLEKVRALISTALKKGSFDNLFWEHSQWASRHQGWLKTMVDNFRPNFHTHPGAQCLHGEIHPANVIYTAQGAEPCFLDFEESVHSYACPAWDLAYAFQRFCLRDNPAPNTIKHRFSIFADGYGSAVPRLTAMMKQIAWFSIAVIVDLRISGNLVTPLSELEKFVKLEKQAEALEDML